jgi:hypothetical protein
MNTMTATLNTQTPVYVHLSQLRKTGEPAAQSAEAQRWLNALAARRPTLRDGGTTMDDGPVRVRVLLLFGDQAEIVADVDDPAAPQRYSAEEIAAAVSVPVRSLPGMRLVADVGEGERLTAWRLV